MGTKFISGWGIAGAACGYEDTCTVLAGLAAAVLTGLPLLYLLWRAGSRLRPPVAIAIISAAALLLTPYLWALDLLLLAVPLVAVMGLLAERRLPYLLVGTFPIGFVILALALAGIAGSLGHDGWSGLLPLVATVLVVGLARPLGLATLWPFHKKTLQKRASL